jgi:alkylation response protein AidB-like acyl-CoA dehydrogenase
VETLSEKAGTRASVARHPIPPFTAEHEEFSATVRRFVEADLCPHAREWEAARWFPNDVFTRMAELGYIALKFPREYGGTGDVGGGTDEIMKEILGRSLGL